MTINSQTAKKFMTSLGALVPALLPDFGPSGQRYAAQDYEWSDE